MEITEIGLSNRQRIYETCFSGYVEITDKEHDYVICLEIVKHFEGDGLLTVDVLTDSDDGFYTANAIKRIFYNNNELSNLLPSICVKVQKDEIERYICLMYKVTDGTLTSGEITARMSSNMNPWFTTCPDTVACR